MTPDMLAMVLDWLPGGARLHIPGDVLQRWFPHAPGSGEVDAHSFEASRRYAAAHGCGFGYDDDVHVGIFTKLDPVR